MGPDDNPDLFRHLGLDDEGRQQRKVIYRVVRLIEIDVKR
jgi:hypothetical protein